MQNVDVTRYRNYKIKLCFEHLFYFESVLSRLTLKISKVQYRWRFKNSLWTVDEMEIALSTEI